MNQFKVGDKVVPVRDHGLLSTGKVYTVSQTRPSFGNENIFLEIKELGIEWFAYRFRHAQKSVLEDEEYKSLFI